MSWKLARIGLLVVLAGGYWAQTATAQTVPPGPVKKAAKSNKAPAPKPEALPPAVSSPPRPQTPAEPTTLGDSAPVKPNVTLQSGMLTIDAPNSTLSDVLNGVHKATGASIEGISPPDRVAVKLGPGSPEQVIAALLHGTPYDYVILGSPGHQDVITRVLISSAVPVNNQGNRGQPAPGPAEETEQPPNDENSPSAQQDADPEPMQQPMVSPRARQPGTPPEETEEQQQQQQQPPQQPQQQQQQQPQQQQQQPPKTVDELFRELQLMRPQQQQPAQQ
jgi:hypothetical protein